MSEKIQKASSSQEKYWDEYIKRDRCFLSDSDTAFDVDQNNFSRKIFVNIENKNLLEIGCGDGADAIGVVKKFNCNSLVAIDLAEERVKICKKNIQKAGLADKITTMQMDAHQLKFRDNSFDVVYCNSVVLFLEREKFFSEVIRVLKPDGKLLLLGESLADNPILRIYRNIWPSEWKRNAEKYTRRLSLTELESLGNKYFLKTDHREFHLFFSIICRFWPWFLNRIIRDKTWYQTPSCKLGRALDTAILDKFPRSRKYAWLTVVSFSNPKKNNR